MFKKHNANIIKLNISADVLQTVFDECDCHDHDETGGRIVGVYQNTQKKGLQIEIQGVIEPGPKAQRTSTSFFQDGDYQAGIFRQIEKEHPEIEHLGNWHTHHVNGYPTLSGGDIGTYQRIVNHENHNLNFFYALLVVSRNPSGEGLERYNVRHYVLFREDDNVYEIAPKNIQIIDKAIVWPLLEDNSHILYSAPRQDMSKNSQNQETYDPPADGLAIRASDQEMLKKLYPQIRPYMSEESDTFYWKGKLNLIDDSTITVMIPEVSSAKLPNKICYQALGKNLPASCKKVTDKFNNREFASAIVAIREFEHQLNHTMYKSLKSSKK